MRYSLIAWDFDGTLFDTVPHTASILRTALEELGGHDSDENLRAQVVGTIPRACAYYGQKFGLDSEVLREHFRDHYRAVEPGQLHPYPGAGELLERIRASGRENCLYTMRGDIVLRYLDFYRLTPLFSRIITADSGYPPKPDPAALSALLAQTGTPPERLLMVGDREMDLLSAKGAGAHACLHNTNRLTPPPSADYVITALPQLWPLL